MINKGGVIPTKREVEEKLSKMGDYVKIDYLTGCLRGNVDFDTRKFVLTKLVGIYEARGMFGEAAKLMRASADINTTFDGKVADFVKSVSLYIKAGTFDEADISFNKALAVANDKQKQDLRAKRKEMYKMYAQDSLKKDKRKHAMSAYEKLLTLDLDQREKEEAQNILIKLYEKLGKVKEFYSMQKTRDNPAPPVKVIEKPKEEPRKGSYVWDVDSLFD